MRVKLIRSDYLYTHESISYPVFLKVKTYSNGTIAYSLKCPQKFNNQKLYEEVLKELIKKYEETGKLI